MAATGVLELASLPVEILSGGERQRAMLARALAQQPRLFVLDEPTAHLDLRYQMECATLLARVNRERGTSMLLVSHDLNLAAQLCDRLRAARRGADRASGARLPTFWRSRCCGLSMAVRSWCERSLAHGRLQVQVTIGRRGGDRARVEMTAPVKGSRYGHELKPARSRHCVWGATSRSVRRSHCPRRGWEGEDARADPRVRRPASRPLAFQPFRARRSGPCGDSR